MDGSLKKIKIKIHLILPRLKLIKKEYSVILIKE
jgi:hypothetical protein